MSKRRKKGNKPNIPQATLDRARQQAGLPVEEPVEEIEEEPVKAQAAPKSPSKPKDTRPARRTRARSTGSVQLDTRKKRRSEPETYQIEDALAHPTVFPDNEDLQAEYGFVLRDLRNMFLLAAVLMVALVLMASFI
ncbi:MAG: hypothetical protein CL607_11305 [Anaerolineaceae bacterium]|nr:hypothetical protein [Anaerolineaceae bacterium]